MIKTIERITYETLSQESADDIVRKARDEETTHAYVLTDHTIKHIIKEDKKTGDIREWWEVTITMKYDVMSPSKQ